MGITKTHSSKFITIIRRLILLLILAVILWFLYIHAGKLLCHIAIGQIGELTNTKISAGSIKFQSDGSVIISDLVIKPLKSQYPNSDILKAKKVYARFNKRSLFLLKPTLNVIDVNDFLLNVLYDLDTGWSNLSDLTIKPPRGSYSKIPDINLDDGILQYVKISDGNEKVAVLLPLEVTFIADEESPQGHSFNITTATMGSGYGQSHLSGFWKPGNVTIAGGISSLNVPEFEMAWIIDVLAAELKYDQSRNYSLELTVKDMQSLRSGEPNGLTLDVPAFIENYNIFTALQGFLDAYKPKGLVDIKLEMEGNLSRLTDSTLKGTLNCRDIAFNYHRFQYLIEHLIGDIVFTQNGLSFDNLKGKHGDSEFLFTGQYRSLGSEREYEVNITSETMPLDDDLYKVLNTKQQKFWSAFSPVGNVKVDLQFNRNAETGKDINLKLELLDVEAMYYNFPYPLKSLTGSLILSRDKITLQDVVSQNGDLKINLNGQIITYEKEESTYDVSIELSNVPLDSTLEAALPDRQKEFYKQYHPAGLMDGSVNVFVQDSGDTAYIAELDFKDASLKIDSLSLPISNVSAQTVFISDMIEIEELFGQYGDMPISLSGHVIPDQQQQQLCYNILLDLEKVQMDNDELSGLLPESIKKIIQRINPTGSINLTADFKKEDLAIPTDYTVTVDCLSNSINFLDYPYPILNVTGTMIIDSDSVKLENISASLGDSIPEESDRAVMSLNGEINFPNGVFGNAELEISARDVLLNEQFGQLLPEENRDFYSTLSPTGRIDLDFKEFLLLNGKNDQKIVDFNCVAALDECGYVMSGDHVKLDSEIQIQGRYIAGKGLNNCKAVIDNGRMVILGKTVSGMKAEIHYDPNLQKWSSEDLVAVFYDGKATGKFEFIMKENLPLEYVLQTAFNNVSLERFLSETKLSEKQDNTYSSGKMSGSLSLSSQVAKSNSRIGTCRVAIKDMQVGKMSPLANLLQVLNLNEPSDYAFDSMFIDSYIRKNELLIEKLDMSGNSVAFYGSGTVDLSSREVDLTLISRGRRLATDDPSVLASLTEGLGQAVVRMEVTGDCYDPKVATRTLPVLEETLQILGTKPEESE